MRAVKPQTARLMKKIDRVFAEFESVDSGRLLAFLQDPLGVRYGMCLIAICSSVDVTHMV